MNLRELVELTLTNLNEDLDTETINEMEPNILNFLNIAYGEIMQYAYKDTYMDQAYLYDGKCNKENLTFWPNEIVGVYDAMGKPLAFNCNDTNIFVLGQQNSYIRIEYTYLPKLSDEPMEETPKFEESLHYILADYATYRILICGGRARQQRAQPFYNSYLQGLSKLRAINIPTIKNKY